MDVLAHQSGILIFGFGREGAAFYTYAEQHVPQTPLYILDDNIAHIPLGKNIAGMFDASKDLASQLKSCAISLVVRSPGVSIYRPEFEVFKSANIPVITGTDIWLQRYPNAQTIAITGTKGKSTTASLIHFILSQLGYDTAILGNLGVPLLASEPAKDFTVVELSSYQTADLQHAPTMAVITNLFQEHLLWHQNVANYHHDKLRLARLDQKTKVFCLEGDETVQAGLKNVTRLHAISSAEMTLKDGILRQADVVWAHHVPLKGTHNMQNLALAFGVVRAAIGAKNMRFPLDFSAFKQLGHRLEEHILLHHMLAVDDSIATIPQATLSALQIYQHKQVHLFLGGQDRGIDYHMLVEQLPQFSLKSLCLFGPVGLRIKSLLTSKLCANLIVADSLAKVIQHAFDHAAAEDVFLLSPAAPSFDEFDNFAHRGRFFVDQCYKAVQALDL